MVCRNDRRRSASIGEKGGRGARKERKGRVNWRTFAGVWHGGVQRGWVKMGHFGFNTWPGSGAKKAVFLFQRHKSHF